MTTLLDLPLILSANSKLTHYPCVIGLCSIQTDFELVLSPAETNPDLPTKAPIPVRLAFSGVPLEVSR